MTTRVVNLRKETHDVYIGRPGHGESGPFGNPIREGFRCQECGTTHATKAETLPCFQRIFLRRVETDSVFRSQVLACKDKRLGCFCAPAPCHGEVIAAWLDGTTWPPKPPQASLFGGL